MLKMYAFWLLVVSVLIAIVERIFPWRKNQRVFRHEYVQDIFWLVFNGFLMGFLFSWLYGFLDNSLNKAFFAVFNKSLISFKIISGQSLFVRVIIVLVVGDFIEWAVHVALHRSKFLFRFHRVHHSIVDMDWIGSFRFHWSEAIFYYSIKYIPLAILGAGALPILISAIITTTIGHLNHSNMKISWGPFRYILNSPRMHIWHHDKSRCGKTVVNFAVVFSLWDWIFRTAYMPKEAKIPEELGFRDQNKVNNTLPMRFFLPFLNKKSK